MLKIKLLMLVILLTCVPMLQAQESDTLPEMAFVANNQLSIVNNGIIISLVDPYPYHGFGATWSPDGQRMAYYVPSNVAPDAAYTARLFVVSRDGTDPTEILTVPLYMDYITWSVDGSQIIYAAVSGNYNEYFHIVDVYSVAPQSGAVPTLLGTIQIGEGCGGGSAFPSDVRYWDETGLNGNGEIFEMTPFGLVFNASCGGANTALANLESGESTPLIEGEPGLMRAQLSPDKTKVAGINVAAMSVEGIAVVDLATREVTTITAESVPDQIAWSNDGSIYYSTRIEEGNMLADATDDAKAKVEAYLGYLPETLPIYQVSIYRVGMDGTSAQIYTAPAYAIGRMAEIPGEGTLIFTQIPNQEAWFTAIENGMLSLENANPELASALIQTELYQLPQGATAQLIAAGYSRFVLNTGAY